MIVVLLLLAGIVKFGKADHVVALGVGLPPTTVGPGIPITPFHPDPTARWELVDTVPSGFSAGEVITLRPPCYHVLVGPDWTGPWTSGYTAGDVYWPGMWIPSLDIDLPPSTAAFVFYVAPNSCDEYLVEVRFSDGKSIQEAIRPSVGAEGFAVFEHEELGSPTGVSISSSFIDVVVGEFYLGMNAPPVAKCQPPITKNADANCQAFADINNGSYDSDTAADELTIVQTPKAPLQLGDTFVEMTVSDGSLSASCTTTVTVENNAPLITPLAEITVFVGGSVQLSVEASDIQDLSHIWDDSGCPDGATIVDASTSTPTLSIATGTSPGFCQVSVEVCDACGGCVLATGMVSLKCSIDPLSRGHLFMDLFFCHDFYCRLSLLTLQPAL